MKHQFNAPLHSDASEALQQLLEQKNEADFEILFAKEALRLTPEQKNVLLREAAFYECEQAVNLLCKAGAQINALGASGETALWEAVSTKNTIIVKLLLSLGAEPNIPSEFKKVPLFLAASLGELEIVNLLLKAGASVNETSLWSQTPLHIAAHHGYRNIAHRLIAEGADLYCLDEHEKTPISNIKEISFAHELSQQFRQKQKRNRELPARKYANFVPSYDVLKASQKAAAALPQERLAAPSSSFKF